MYDQLANRWVHHAVRRAAVPTDECIAVSTTSDATGAGTVTRSISARNFFDYPHLGVWPDGYYMSKNVFNSATEDFLGPQPFAFDRAAMIAGAPATFVTPGITGGPLKRRFFRSISTGLVCRRQARPQCFVETPFGGAYKVFHFHADFVTPGNSTFTLSRVPPPRHSRSCARRRVHACRSPAVSLSTGSAIG